VVDTVDVAQERIDKELEERIKAARGCFDSGTDSLNECIDCGCEISSARQLAVPGCTMCVECAGAYERRAV